MAAFAPRVPQPPLLNCVIPEGLNCVMLIYADDALMTISAISWNDRCFHTRNKSIGQYSNCALVTEELLQCCNQPKNHRCEHPKNIQKQLSVVSK